LNIFSYIFYIFVFSIAHVGPAGADQTGWYNTVISHAGVVINIWPETKVLPPNDKSVVSISQKRRTPRFMQQAHPSDP
jgi:hypothetical protein